MNKEVAASAIQTEQKSIVGHADVMSESIKNNKSLIAFASEISRDETAKDSLRERARNALLEDMIPFAHLSHPSKASLHNTVGGGNKDIPQQAFEKLQSHTHRIDLKVTEANDRALSILVQMATKEDLKKLKDSTFNYLMASTVTIILSLAYFMTTMK